MRFRAKIFLAIFIPAALLVAIAVGVVLAADRREAEASAARDFTRTSNAFKNRLQDQLARLLKESAAFARPRFEEAVKAAAESGELDLVTKDLEFQFDVIENYPDFYELRDTKGKVLLRHPPLARGAVPPPPPPVEAQPILTEIAGEPFIAVRFENEGGTFTLGRSFKADLKALSEQVGIGVVLLQGDRIVFSSVEGWSPALGVEGDLEMNGARYRAAKDQPANSRFSMVVLLKSMEDVDRRRKRALLAGAAGVAGAGFLAAVVSLLVSTGVSRPVEVLTEAARKVAAGDYEVQVEISEKGEMGRMGKAFNEMTVGLRKRKEIMEKTLSRDVAEEFMKGTERGGERRVVTIVFMDIRGFTSGTEGVDPADVLDMLNDLMELLASAIEKHGGNVNKFLGDGLMAMFGAPKPLEGHAGRAVRAALEMQEKMRIWNGSRHARGLPSFYSGIGINTGTAVCGKVGARNRLEYTLIGEEVNLTSRICGKAAPRQVLITRQVLIQAGDEFKVNPLEPVQVKGLSYPIEIFEVLG